MELNNSGAEATLNGTSVTSVTRNGEEVLDAGPSLGTTLSLSPPNNSDGSPNINGLFISPNETIAGVRVRVASGEYEPDGYSRLRAIDGFGDAIGPVEDATGLEPGDEFDYYLDEPRENDFGIGLDDDGNEYTRSRYEEDDQFPHEGVELDVDGGLFSDAPGVSPHVVYNFDEVTAILE